MRAITAEPVWRRDPRDVSQASERSRVPSFETLYREHHARLHRFCLGMTRRDPIAEDIAQETLLRAFLHWDELDPDRSAWPWLKKVATRLVYDHTRNRRDVCSEPSNDEVVPDAAGVYADRDFVRQMLGALPERQRAAVTLRYLDDWKSAEIAAVLDLPRPAVEQLLLRARRSLRTEYRRLSADRLRLALWPLLGWSMRLRHRAARGAEALGDAWLPSMGTAADSLSALVIASVLTVGATLAANPPARAMAVAGYDADLLRIPQGVAETPRDNFGSVESLAEHPHPPALRASRSVPSPPTTAQVAPASREDVAFSASPPLLGGSEGEPIARTSVRRDDETVRSNHNLVIDIAGHPAGVGGADTWVDCDAGMVGAAACSAYDAAVGVAPDTP